MQHRPRPMEPAHMVSGEGRPQRQSVQSPKEMLSTASLSSACGTGLTPRLCYLLPTILVSLALHFRSSLGIWNVCQFGVIYTQ